VKPSQKRLWFTVILLSAIVGVAVRLYSVINSDRGLFSFHNIDLFILCMMAIVSAISIIKLKSNT
jgi:hypothetical protein